MNAIRRLRFNYPVHGDRAPMALADSMGRAIHYGLVCFVWLFLSGGLSMWILHVIRNGALPPAELGWTMTFLIGSVGAVIGCFYVPILFAVVVVLLRSNRLAFIQFFSALCGIVGGATWAMMINFLG